MRKKRALEAFAFTVLSVVFTLLLKCIDISLAPSGGLIGFSSVNIPLSRMLPFNETIYSITETLGYVAFLPVAVFGLLGLIQLVKRKSLKKVDGFLYALVVLYILMAGLYIFFDKVYVVNMRPIIIPGEEALAPSFPSSHTLLSIVLLGSALVECGRIGKKGLRMVVSLLLWILLLSIVAGRLLSGVHWLTDIIGGILWGETLLLWFLFFEACFSRRKKA